MALSIKNEEADRLARELADTTGESLTEAVVTALRERLERERGRTGLTRLERIRRLREDVLRMPVADARGPGMIIEYDDHGLPL